MKIVKPAIFILLMINAYLLEAQVVFQVEGKADLPANVIYIANRGTQNIRFSLSLNRNQWQNFQLRSRTSGNAWPRDNNNFQFIYIKVNSDNGNVEYKLMKQKRYQIYWNSNTSRWDVGEMQA